MFNCVEQIEVSRTPDGFPYIDVGDEGHGKPSFRLWVSHKLIKSEGSVEVLKFPVLNARIIKTEKGSLVLKPHDGYVTHYVFLKCGFRGVSQLKVSPPDIEAYYFRVVRSPRGSLGISEGLLFSCPTDMTVIIEGLRNGRLYGAPSVGTVVISGANIKEYEGITVEKYFELQELKDLLE